MYRQSRTPRLIRAKLQVKESKRKGSSITFAVAFVLCVPTRLVGFCVAIARRKSGYFRAVANFELWMRQDAWR